MSYIIIVFYSNYSSYWNSSSDVLAPAPKVTCRKISIIVADFRDVQPANIFFTRAGTVKLGHFGQSCSLLPKIGSVDADYSNDENYMACKTPVGKEEFMCAEKVYQYFSLDSRQSVVGDTNLIKNRLSSFSSLYF